MTTEPLSLELPLDVPLQPNEIYLLEYRETKHYWGTQSKPSSFSIDGYVDCFVKSQFSLGWKIWTTTRSETTLAGLKERFADHKATHDMYNKDIENHPQDGATFREEFELRVTKAPYKE